MTGGHRMMENDPLSNHVILESIFKNLDVPDLKAVRLVRSSWKEASLNHWRKTAVLVLKADNDDSDIDSDGDGDSSDSSHSSGGGDQLTFSEFREINKNIEDHHGHLKLGRKPFSKYKLVRWNFVDPEEEEEEEEVDFIRDHGPLIEYLHLDRCEFSSFSTLEDLLTRRLPNLKKLVWSLTLDLEPEDDYKVTTDQEGEDEDAGPPPETIFSYLSQRHPSRDNFSQSLKVLEMRVEPQWIARYAKLQLMANACKYLDSEYWTRLLYCMPAVEDVKLQILECENIVTYGECLNGSMSHLLSALKWVSRLHGGSKIRKLDIMDFFVDANSTFGREENDNNDEPKNNKILDLPFLESLSIDWGSITSENCSTKVLENLSDSLQVLKVFRVPGDKSLPQFITRLPFPGNMDPLRELYLYGNVTENLAFLRYTPNLEVLVMVQACFELRHKMNGTTLRACSRGGLVSNTEEILLSQKKTAGPSSSLIVPSLKSLQVDYPMNPASVSTLAKWLPNVTTVKMVMDNEILSATCRAWPKLEEIECLYRSEVDDAGASTLVQCSELRKFKINSLCGQTIRLTSSSVNQFVKISSLQELDICTSDQVKASEAAKLLDKLTAMKLISRNDHDNLDYECCEWKGFLQRKGLVPTPPKLPIVIGTRCLRSGRNVVVLKRPPK